MSTTDPSAQIDDALAELSALPRRQEDFTRLLRAFELLREDNERLAEELAWQVRARSKNPNLNRTIHRHLDADKGIAAAVRGEGVNAGGER